ncbi:hypothetical protein Droror1_Dr00001462 [Drosera rotundifolia]
MRRPSSLKEEFLKKWASRLQMWNLSSRKMTLMERKKAIKLSANLAMASTRSCTTLWSRALIMANASKDRMLELTMPTKTTTRTKEFNAIRRKKTIMAARSRRRSKCIHRYGKCRGSVTAKRLLERRTQVLKGLLPGGELMDESDLFKEALDYILSLKAQVDVMETLVNVHSVLKPKIEG